MKIMLGHLRAFCMVNKIPQFRYAAFGMEERVPFRQQEKYF